MKRTLSVNQKGFTIIELMIATSVLSVVLVMATVMMIGIGNLYYKGINQTRIQNTVRNISDDLIQNLQLSKPSSVRTGVNVAGDTRAVCVGSTRYSYDVMDRKIGEAVAHVLWRDTITPGTCSPVDLTQANPPGINGAELMAPNSRLTAFCVGVYVSATDNCSTVVTPTETLPYTITISIAYGDSDLLNLDRGFDANCKGGIGRQFCATAKLQTTVVQRL